MVAVEGLHMRPPSELCAVLKARKHRILKPTEARSPRQMGQVGISSDACYQHGFKGRNNTRGLPRRTSKINDFHTKIRAPKGPYDQV